MPQKILDAPNSLNVAYAIIQDWHVRMSFMFLSSTEGNSYKSDGNNDIDATDKNLEDLNGDE